MAHEEKPRCTLRDGFPMMTHERCCLPPGHEPPCLDEEALEERDLVTDAATGDMERVLESFGHRGDARAVIAALVARARSLTEERNTWTRRAIDDLARAKVAESELAAERARIDALTRYDRVWPLRDVLLCLQKATSHLMVDHSCDAHGYESICAAADVVPELLRALDVILLERASDAAMARSTKGSTP